MFSTYFNLLAIEESKSSSPELFVFWRGGNFCGIIAFYLELIFFSERIEGGGGISAWNSLKIWFATWVSKMSGGCCKILWPASTRDLFYLELDLFLALPERLELRELALFSQLRSILKSPLAKRFIEIINFEEVN